MSFTYEAEIAHAIDHAPAVYLDEDGTISYNPMLDLLHNQPDDARVNLNMDELPVTGDNRIIVPTLEEFSQLHRETLAAIGVPFGDRQQDQIEHENQHAKAQKLLGAQAVTFGVRFSCFYENKASTAYRLAVLPFATPHQLQSTKLGIAAGTAHPIELSTGDTANLETLGYDIDEIGRKAIMHNETHDTIIPVPLSYRPSGTTYVL
jgi:hypothetical protein